MPHRRSQAFLGTLPLVAVALAATAGLGGPAAAGEPETIDVPELASDWWQIAPNAPDVGQWATGKENACDFTLFQSADGRWHCIACIRGTSHYGRRLFYRWESDRLTAPDWTPKGIVEVPRGKRGRPPEFTSVQAPHAFRHGGRYYLFYNSGPAHCMISPDGREWTPHTNVAGEQVFFQMGRDVCVFHDAARDRWIAYYCGTAEVDGERRGAMVARTAPTPEGPWSETETPVRTEGNPESPFVLKRGRWYYLFQQMNVFRSADPLDFNRPQIAHMTGIWYGGRYAPEVIEHEGRFYLAGYSRGIHVAEMRWAAKTPAEIEAWRKTELARIQKEREAARRRRQQRERERKEKEASR
ncbi:MAG: hypothetical protein R6X20_09280 [Phycisphaerae bacterium]